MGTNRALPHPPSSRHPKTQAQIERIRIIVSPSFEIDECFHLRAKAEKSTGQIRHRLIYKVRIGDSPWDRASGQIWLSNRQVRAISDLCRDIKKVQALDELPAIGLDGTTTEITIIHGKNKFELEYWEKAPKQWGPVEKLVKKVRAIARREASKRAAACGGEIRNPKGLI